MLRKYNDLLVSILLLSAMVLSSSATSQNAYALQFTIRGSSGQMAYLVSYYLDKEYVIDSSAISLSGRVGFNLHADDNCGLYRLRIDKDAGLDFIFNKEQEVVDITTDMDFSVDSAVVKSSDENKVLFEYLRKKSYYDDRIEPMIPLLRYYPPSDTFYHVAERHALRLDHDYQEFIERVLREHPEMLATRLIRFNQLEKIEPASRYDPRREFLKSHYFDSVGLDDTTILYTPVLAGKVVNYLSLYVVPGAPREKQEASFITGVDSLMHFASVNKTVQDAIVNYLITGFQAYGFETVLMHIVENYVLGQSCVSDQEEAKLQKRIEGFKLLATGNKAPDFEARDMEGKIIQLSALDAPYRLLLFWSGECPHCDAMIGPLKTISEKFPGKMQVISISVDSDEKVWKQAIQRYGMDWINIAELKGWDGRIVQDYHVYATPTLLLLDSSLTIIAKPNNTGELNMVLSGLN